MAYDVFGTGKTALKFNVGTIVQVNETWGPLYERPQLIMQARYVRFGSQIDF